MARTFDFLFDLDSPFAYLAFTQMPPLCQRTAATCAYRPVFLGGIMKATGNRPPAAVIPKGAYLMQELKTWAEIFDVPFAWPPARFPIGNLLPIRAVTHAFAQGEEAGVALAAALYRAHWGEQRDIVDDPAVLDEAARAAGLDPTALREAAASQPVKDALRAATEDAVARGAFGVPTFYVEGRMLWGVDKLPWLEALLAGRAPCLPRC